MTIMKESKKKLLKTLDQIKHKHGFGAAKIILGESYTGTPAVFL